MHVPAINSFFFGYDDSLFGIYHVPPPARDRREGVVICAPIGREYIRSHRALRMLAARLSDAGLHVLRFDYYGCGDSVGDGVEGHPDRWTEDIAAAVSELQEQADIQGVNLLGLRMGATLAAYYGSHNGGLIRLVLWDPMLTGERFLKTQRNGHQDWLAELTNLPAPEILDTGIPELLGFPYPASLQKSLAELDLLSAQRSPAEHILLLENDPGEDGDVLAKHFQQLGANFHREQLPGSKVWQKESGMHSVLIPIQSLQVIGDYLTGKTV